MKSNFSESELKQIYIRLFSNASSRSLCVSDAARKTISQLSEQNPHFTFQYLSEMMKKNPPISEQDSVALLSAFTNCCDKIETEKIISLFLFLQQKVFNFKSKSVIIEWNKLCAKFIKSEPIVDIVDQNQIQSNIGVLTLSYCTKYHYRTLEKEFNKNRKQIFSQISPFVLSVFFSHLSLIFDDDENAFLESDLLESSFLFLLNYNVQYPSLTITNNLYTIAKNISKITCLMNPSEIIQNIIDTFSQKYDFYNSIIPLLYELTYTQQNALTVFQFYIKIYKNSTNIQIQTNNTKEEHNIIRNNGKDTDILSELIQKSNPININHQESYYSVLFHHI